jgi:hypothetical protein
MRSVVVLNFNMGVFKLNAIMMWAVMLSAAAPFTKLKY